jgi:NAD(P)H-quinone oxidoreductase subunit 5
MNPADLLTAVVALPGCTFLLLAALWFLGIPLTEKAIARLTSIVFILASFGVAALAFMPGPVRADLGDALSTGHYHFPLTLVLDRLSLPLVGLTVLLTGLIGAFSARYMHRETGFHRFFLLLHLFAFGSLLLFTAGSLDLLVGGWELVGLTSVLLIAFFQERPEPAHSALRVFATYRAADVGLLVAVFVAHHHYGAASFDSLITGSWPDQSTAVSGWSGLLLALLLLLAASGKSAQAPFSGWLPRAMEGPTPSSAIFYGAISVHAGTYLLLRMQPVIASSPLASALVVAVGLISAILATMSGRVSADAKTSLAYASMTQLGLIFAEIGLDLPTIALWHICGHAATRTLQFLRAPSALHEFHQMHAAAGGHMEQTGTHLEALFPVSMRTWLYRLALDRGHPDAMLDRFFARPLVWAGALLQRFSVPKLPSRPSQTAPRVTKDLDA